MSNSNSEQRDHNRHSAARQHLTLIAVGVIVFFTANALGHLTQALASQIGF